MKKYLAFMMVLLILIHCTGCMDPASRTVKTSTTSPTNGGGWPVHRRRLQDDRRPVTELRDRPDRGDL